MFKAIESGTFGQPDDFLAMISAVRDHGDYYLVSDDFHSYIETHAAIDEAYKNQDEWLTKSITSVARMGFFSSDRCINEYAEESKYHSLQSSQTNNFQFLRKHHSQFRC